MSISTSIPASDLTHSYQALTILTQAQLDASLIDNAPTSANYYINTYVRNNFFQLGSDVFGDTYEFTNDGTPAFPTPLIDRVALLDDDEVITGAWTFNETTTFVGIVDGQSTFSSSGQTRGKAFRTTTNQSIVDSTPTAIIFNGETYDVNGIHNTGVNPTRMTIPSGSAGVYVFTAQVTFDNNVTGRREVAIYKNGSKLGETKLFGNDAAQDTVLQVQAQDEAAAADYYEVFVVQTSGGALDVVLGADVTNFAALKVW